MKLSTSLLLTATAGIVASAQPHHNHNHNHLHAQKRNAAPEADVIRVPGPVVFIYELGGHIISAEDVQEGIKNGSLVYASVASVASTSSSVAATTVPTVLAIQAHTRASSTVATTTSIVDLSSVLSHAPSTTSSAAPTTSSTTSSATSPPTTTTSSSSTSTTSKVATATTSSSGSGSYPTFPDGELDCSTFPSAYGAVAVNYLGIGGWAGIQSPGSSVGGYSDIVTVNTNTCTSGDCCGEGMFCSYACAPGYQKSQWPSTQGATGQSVGGLQCLNGKLRLTNPSLSTSLCIPGTQVVSVLVQNTLNQNVAVCRTDYPGTESETIPLNAQPGTITNLTCPAATSYYTWKGLSTSAQYYVNPAGVSVANACQWGDSSEPWGNYAPMNLGVGYSDGMAWLSIFQNSPTTDAKLGFTVELVGDNGGYDNLVGRCKYENGQYCSGIGYQTCSSTTGCTVSLKSGTATYVFS